MGEYWMIRYLSEHGGGFGVAEGLVIMGVVLVAIAYGVWAGHRESKRERMKQDEYDKRYPRSTGSRNGNRNRHDTH